MSRQKLPTENVLLTYVFIGLSYDVKSFGRNGKVCLFYSARNDCILPFSSGLGLP